jgi:hypothetical protein
MPYLSRRRHGGKNDPRAILPLFDWADARTRRKFPDFPTRWIQRRLGVSADRASLIARLAGLGREL